MDSWGTDQQSTPGHWKPIFKSDANDVFGISWTVTNWEELDRDDDYGPLDDDDCTFFVNTKAIADFNMLKRVTAIRNVFTFHSHDDGDVVGSVWFSLPFSAVDKYTFTIDNLPADTHLSALLGSIRNVGRIYASKMENNVGKVTFAERASADRFWQRHSKGLLVGSIQASVSRHVNTERDTIRAPEGVSRAIKIVGNAGLVNRDWIAGILNNNTHGPFDTEYVTQKTELTYQYVGTVEWVFGSCKQANLAYALIGGVLERFTEDVKSRKTELAEMGVSPVGSEQLMRLSYGKDPSV